MNIFSSEKVFDHHNKTIFIKDFPYQHSHIKNFLPDDLIKKVSENIDFHKVAVAFSGDYTFLFENFFKIQTIYPFAIKKTEIDKFDTVFQLTLEIKSLVNQKYSRSNIFEEIINFFNIKKNSGKKIEAQKNNPINKKTIPFIKEKIKAESAKKITTNSE